MGKSVSNPNNTLNETMIDFNEEAVNLKTENILLRELNFELQDKNLLLKELLAKYKSEPKLDTYASISTRIPENTRVTKNKQVPNLIIKAKKNKKCK